MGYTHGFHPVVPILNLEVGMETQFFSASPSMEKALFDIGITLADHTLYLTTTETGALKIVPVRCPDENGDQNEYHRTKEIAMLQGMEQWVRMFDQENKSYRWFPAPEGRFADPIFPELSHARTARLQEQGPENRRPEAFYVSEMGRP
jgi:hypothetical protein